jgi:hypothetical protein
LSSSNLIRWSGLAAMLAGVLWVVPAIITAFKPRGCIGPEECDVMAMRDTSDLAPLLLLALMLSAVGLAGMVIRAWNTGRFDRLGQVSVALCAVGVMLLVLGMGLNAISEVFWALVPLGGLALVIGLALVGIAALRMEALPRWAAVLLVIGSLGMLGFNDQNAQVLMAIPFGIGWVAVGYALWSGREASADQPSRVR